MTISGTRRPDVNSVLSTLKDFQRDSVDYVVRRLYDDEDRVSRFLIADEVGLGKTLVARGVIATAVDRLWDSIDRIDVLYICSNQDIARQNIDRLNITHQNEFQFTSRPTLLPITIQQLQGNKLNFISFTPGTSFNMRSRGGIKQERWVLYKMIRQVWDIDDGSLFNLLRGAASKRHWRNDCEWWDKNLMLSEELTSRFHGVIRGKKQLYRRLAKLANEVGSRRTNLTDSQSTERDMLTGELRQLLARECLNALEPDIVILDEFQRFKNLLEKDSELGELAQEVFLFEDVRILLLSATPYKMYTADWEEGEDHYEDFFRTANFLLEGHPERLESLERAVKTFRLSMLRTGRSEAPDLQKAKHQIEEVLQKVMIRTERLGVTKDRNGMLQEEKVDASTLKPEDLRAYVALDRAACAVGERDPIEFWKSSAYPINLMDGYKLKDSIEETLSNGESPALEKVLTENRGQMLSWDAIQRYEPLDIQNPRLRYLVQEMEATTNWQLLWLPPSLPYYRGRGPYSSKKELTKNLIFSSWRVAPKSIATLLSYAAERAVLEAASSSYEYGDLLQKRRGLLQFAFSDDRLVGMPVLALLYPCWTLAEAIDPLQIAQRQTGDGIPTVRQVLSEAKLEIDQLLHEAIEGLEIDSEGRTDERWYWAALGLLDKHHHPHLAETWLGQTEPPLQWSPGDDDPDEDGGTRFGEHVAEFMRVIADPDGLGPVPIDLSDVLALFALAGPAIVPLRALHRVLDQGDEYSTHLMAGAAEVAFGFRTLFNQPETTELVNSLYKSGPYWRKILRYGADGNLQSVMDEYAHILKESLGLIDHDAGESALKIASTMATALGLRSPSLFFDEFVDSDIGFSIEKHGIRCRYALRFGDDRTYDERGATRTEDVRVAFNSPFKPFTLATTSIGQEGLDFHQYCHRVVHWNLPSNPVDLEQREGRVHRYKGHVIRRNLAIVYGRAIFDREAQDEQFDPWREMFRLAEGDRPDEWNDLWPFWIFDVPGGFKIERVLPMLPLSREEQKLESLRDDLVAYRSVLGQPRQDELVSFLARQVSADELADITRRVLIDLSPPPRRPEPKKE